MVTLVAFVIVATASGGLVDPQQDADGDGISDRDEDRNANGVVDPGESDPRSADTDHDNVPDDVERLMGTAPADPRDLPPIPEPLLFDLVRNLGSRRGELEVNVLAATSFRPTRTVQWAPEIEYVPTSGGGLELELPLVDAEVEAVKAGAQATVASFASRRFELGVIGLYERSIHEPGFEGKIAAITAIRLSSRVQALTIVGPTVARRRSSTAAGGTLNPSAFYQATRYMTVGVELGYSVEAPLARSPDARAASSFLALPQVHLNPLPNVKIQLGSGLRVVDRVLLPLTAIRLCWEH